MSHCHQRYDRTRKSGENRFESPDGVGTITVSNMNHHTIHDTLSHEESGGRQDLLDEATLHSEQEQQHTQKKQRPPARPFLVPLNRNSRNNVDDGFYGTIQEALASEFAPPDP